MATEHELSLSSGARCDADGRQAAARAVYDAECALHAARQSRVDEWIAAASRRLHEAIIAHRAVERAARPSADAVAQPTAEAA